MKKKMLILIVSIILGQNIDGVIVIIITMETEKDLTTPSLIK